MDIPLSTKDIEHQISSKICSKCHGASNGWKCPSCGAESASFDPFHWKECDHRAKMQTKCNECGKAENECTCHPKK